jgi:hypothetical protein
MLISETEKKLQEAQDRRKSYLAEMWKHPIFSYERRQAEMKANRATIEVRRLAAKLRELKREKAVGKQVEVKTEAAATAAGLTDAQMQAVIAAIEGLKTQGMAEQDAEKAVTQRLPLQVRARLYPGFFRHFARPRFRPVPGTIPPAARSIDPVVFNRSIDPRVPRPVRLGAQVPGRTIDPVPPGINIPTGVDGAFQFPPSAAIQVDAAIEQQAELAAAAELPEKKPWYMDWRFLGAAALVGAIAMAPNQKAA